MRHIDISSLGESLPQGWADRSAVALEELRRAASKDERAAIMGRQSRIWADLKGILSLLSVGKCWYCETPNLRADNVVDHFRPKGRVAEQPSHEGYWWLAFDYRNFRFACTFCNSRRHGQDTVGGKADHFPIHNEDDRAVNEEYDLDNERPMLLDPTDPADPTLLWFEPDGRAVPRYDEVEHSWFHVKADKSIDLYHLNESRTKSRRRDNHLRLIQTIREAADHLRMSENGEEVSVKGVRNAFGRIRDMVKPSADYSAAAKATIFAYRHEYPWLDQILSTT